MQRNINIFVFYLVKNKHMCLLFREITINTARRLVLINKTYTLWNKKHISVVCLFSYIKHIEFGGE